MYFPGARLAGIFTRSLTALPCQSTPWQEGHGGSNPGRPQFAQRLQVSLQIKLLLQVLGEAVEQHLIRSVSYCPAPHPFSPW